ncbi:hypothetical protein AB6A23_06290 [Paenibacillus tarimensis]
MDFNEVLDWAFHRHLNPLSWYIRPVFLIALAFFAYKRSRKGLIITFVLMMSSMVWFPAPETIDPQMQTVLEYEKMLLSDPVYAFLTLSFMMIFLVLIGMAFWKHSLKLGLVMINITLVGKVVLSLLLTGEDGWAPLGNTIFGIILINGIGLFLLYRMSRKKESITK